MSPEPDFVERSARPDLRGSLSPRSLEVLEKASQGFTNVEIGSQMNISTYAVKWHLSMIYRKLGVSNRTEAASTYLREVSDIAPMRRDG